MCCKTTTVSYRHINKCTRVLWQSRCTSVKMWFTSLLSPLILPPVHLTSWKIKQGTHSVSKATYTLANEKHVLAFPFEGWTPPSIFEPRVGRDGGFTAVPVIVQQLFALINVSRGHEDEVRNTVDVVEFGLAVSIFTVIDQPTHSTSLFSGIHTVEKG